MKNNTARIIVLGIFFLSGVSVFAQKQSILELPWIFSDHMVFQKEKPVVIWGQAEANATVKVECFNLKKKTKADENGCWELTFPPITDTIAGGLTVQSGKEKIQFSDILIGEVWLCAGQSNMYWPLRSSQDGEIEILKADNTDIRLLDMQAPAWPGAGKFTEEQLGRHFPDKYFEGSWKTCTAESAARFSAVAYHFGKMIHDSLKAPIGLIDIAVGGATTESFISRDALSQDPDLRKLLENWFDNELIHPWVKSRTKDNLSLWFEYPVDPRPHHPFEPGMLYESGVEPILLSSIRGVIWYQGESNLSTETDYFPGVQEQNQRLFKTLVGCFRDAFNEPDLPFYYVQLPNINRDWPAYREMQRLALDEIPNTGMAITIDIGNPNNVHPSNKKDVGYRLALKALTKTYEKSIEISSGPLPEKASLENDKVLIKFNHIGNGLKLKSAEFSGFEIAGEDRRFKPANAEIIDNQLSVSHPKIKKPIATRYAWAPNPNATLFNSVDLPASPFRIDLDDQLADEPSYIDVFTAGKDEIQGIFNAPERFAQYREQNVVITNDGTVVAISQAREKSNWSDRSGQDLVVKTSSDNGYSWTQSQLIAVHGNHSIVPNAAIYDKIKNRIHVLYNVTGWDYLNPPRRIKGEMHDDVCKQYVITSGDSGKSWSAPRDISNMIATNGAVAVFGSGEGIQISKGLHAGRIIVPGGDFNKGKQILSFYSDDHGQTWQRGEAVVVPEGTAMASETKVAELNDGRLILNSRTYIPDGQNQRLRSRAFSSDGGITWTPLENDPALKTVSCNAALLAVLNPKGEDGVILLNSLPVGPGRTHGTIYVSFDNGLTWPFKKMIIEEQFAYSSLVQFADGYIGLFYEARGHKDIKLVRFSPEWLLED